MKENDTVLTDFNEKDILEEIEEIKKMILQMKIQMQNYYYIVIEEVSFICEDAKHNIYLSQNDISQIESNRNSFRTLIIFVRKLQRKFLCSHHR